MNAHIFGLALRGGAGLLVLALVVHWWPAGRAAGFAEDNVFLIATLAMSAVSVFLADPLVDDEGQRTILKTLGYFGLAGLGAAAFLL